MIAASRRAIGYDAVKRTLPRHTGVALASVRLLPECPYYYDAKKKCRSYRRQLKT
jgi:hypothetical protein